MLIPLILAADLALVALILWLVWSWTRPGKSLSLYAYDGKWQGGRPALLVGTNADGTVNAVVFLDSAKDVELLKFARFPILSLERCIITDDLVSLVGRFGSELTTCLSIEPSDDPRGHVLPAHVVQSIIVAERAEEQRKIAEAKRAAAQSKADDEKGVAQRMLDTEPAVIPPHADDEG